MTIEETKISDILKRLNTTRFTMCSEGSNDEDTVKEGTGRQISHGLQEIVVGCLQIDSCTSIFIDSLLNHSSADTLLTVFNFFLWPTNCNIAIKSKTYACKVTTSVTVVLKSTKHSYAWWCYPTHQRIYGKVIVSESFVTLLITESHLHCWCPFCCGRRKFYHKLTIQIFSSQQ